MEPCEHYHRYRILSLSPRLGAGSKQAPRAPKEDNAKRGAPDRRSAHGNLSIERQRSAQTSECRSLHAAALGLTRRTKDDGNQIRLRYQRVWRVYRAS